MTSRPMTLDEIQERGIVIDEDNFTVLNFAVGLTLGNKEVMVEFPVAIPFGLGKAGNLAPLVGGEVS